MPGFCRWISLTLLLALIALGCQEQDRAAARIPGIGEEAARIAHVEGQAEIRRPGNPAVAATAELSLTRDDVVAPAAASFVLIALYNGYVVRIGSETAIRVADLAQFNAAPTDLKVEKQLAALLSQGELSERDKAIQEVSRIAGWHVRRNAASTPTAQAAAEAAPAKSASAATTGEGETQLAEAMEADFDREDPSMGEAKFDRKADLPSKAPRPTKVREARRRRARAPSASRSAARPARTQDESADALDRVAGPATSPPLAPSPEPASPTQQLPPRPGEGDLRPSEPAKGFAAAPESKDKTAPLGKPRARVVKGLKKPDADLQQALNKLVQDRALISCLRSSSKANPLTLRVVIVKGKVTSIYLRKGDQLGHCKPMVSWLETARASGRQSATILVELTLP